MVFIFAFTLLGGVGLLGLAVWPGGIEDVVFGLPTLCLFLPLLLCWFLLLIGLALRDIVGMFDPVVRRRWGLWSAAVMFATLGLLWFRVPQRVAFVFCHSELRRLADSAPTTEFGDEELGRRVGPYWVDRYEADLRGGVFFRTHVGPDGIGPDRMSYGFAYRPNGQGTPFGNARYRSHHLFGDWYGFAVSDDS